MRISPADRSWSSPSAPRQQHSPLSTSPLAHSLLSPASAGTNRHTLPSAERHPCSSHRFCSLSACVRRCSIVCAPAILTPPSLTVATSNRTPVDAMGKEQQLLPPPPQDQMAAPRAVPPVPSNVDDTPPALLRRVSARASLSRPQSQCEMIIRMLTRDDSYVHAALCSNKTWCRARSIRS